MKNKKNIKPKIGDVVLTETFAGVDMHVKLVEMVTRPASKGRSMDWPGYTGWYAVPIYKKELDMLKKAQVPVGTIESYDSDPFWVFDFHIIRVVNNESNKKADASKRSQKRNDSRPKRRTRIRKKD